MLRGAHAGVRSAAHLHLSHVAHRPETTHPTPVRRHRGCERGLLRARHAHGAVVALTHALTHLLHLLHLLQLLHLLHLRLLLRVRATHLVVPALLRVRRATHSIVSVVAVPAVAVQIVVHPAVSNGRGIRHGSVLSAQRVAAVRAAAAAQRPGAVPREPHPGVLERQQRRGGASARVVVHTDRAERLRQPVRLTAPAAPRRVVLPVQTRDVSAGRRMRRRVRQPPVRVYVSVSAVSGQGVIPGEQTAPENGTAAVLWWGEGDVLSQKEEVS